MSFAVFMLVLPEDRVTVEMQNDCWFHTELIRSYEVFY